jgi:glycosyltransferase involved in cell wall biosynthesis
VNATSASAAINLDKLSARAQPKRSQQASKQPRRRKISGLVTTYNEATNIRACLESLSWCDEIVVVDSYSDDGTVEIARRFDNVRVLQRRYYGGASQKNWAIDRLRNDWVLILDADERVTPELRKEIEENLETSDPATAYAINRDTYAAGRRVSYSGWQHDRVTRFFNRNAARYPNRRVHADMDTREKPRVLDSSLAHFMVDDFAEYAERLRRYAWWGAGQLWRNGHRTGAFEVLTRPVWKFFRTFFLQLGFLDGGLGLVMCGLHGYGTFLKYVILWGWQNDQRHSNVPVLPEFDDETSTWAWPGQKQSIGVIDIECGLSGQATPSSAD